MFEGTKSLLEQGSTVGGIAFSSSNNSFDPLKTPAINGRRFKLLASILILSQLKDQQAFNTVLKISNHAIKQRDQLFADNVLRVGFKFSILSRASLYNKRILATALLNMRGENELAKKYKWEEIKMVNFDAKATPYDRIVTRWTTQGKVDYPPKDRIVRLIAPLTDEEFAVLVKAVQ
ncbi:MAG: hypothetical protein JKY95_11220 [Planctomycetaceae bacterium]|nr:hypothetical protein [Planctomycetaceae bacterium]